MNEKNLIKEFTNAVLDMRKNHHNGTYHWLLDTDDNGNDWAIVLGWSDGFEEDPTDDCTDGTYRLCAKLAYHPHNSIMQCDYDVDWLMPYDEKTGEVYDNELSIFPNSSTYETVNWLLRCYLNYAA